MHFGLFESNYYYNGNFNIFKPFTENQTSEIGHTKYIRLG